ncbi:hypothetical protein RFI_27660 [Reticulomyxa filosa]|uniref:Uncharacterized protein n=1 Tax=Reticulomyxa filosa TaxID=46433 RepID=X6M9M3_RETFI|nr:hypothetical protein RFI_27660 [Reticulomyxa filosa]|eukprot:ETO09715.1 hypothetical protein RFI_27660 [Reticulomyxa filosa]
MSTKESEKSKEVAHFVHRLYGNCRLQLSSYGRYLLVGNSILLLDSEISSLKGISWSNQPLSLADVSTISPTGQYMMQGRIKNSGEHTILELLFLETAFNGNSMKTKELYSYDVPYDSDLLQYTFVEEHEMVLLFRVPAEMQVFKWNAQTNSKTLTKICAKSTLLTPFENVVTTLIPSNFNQSPNIYFFVQISAMHTESKDPTFEVLKLATNKAELETVYSTVLKKCGRNKMTASYVAFSCDAKFLAIKALTQTEYFVVDLEAKKTVISSAITNDLSLSLEDSDFHNFHFSEMTWKLLPSSNEENNSSVTLRQHSLVVLRKDLKNYDSIDVVVNDCNWELSRKQDIFRDPNNVFDLFIPQVLIEIICQYAGMSGFQLITKKMGFNVNNAGFHLAYGTYIDKKTNLFVSNIIVIGYEEGILYELIQILKVDIVLCNTKKL